MKTSTDVLGKQVISLDGGALLGTVDDLLFSENQSHVLGFSIKTGMFGEPIIIAFADIDAFGPDALVARPAGSVGSEPGATAPERQPAVQGKRVITRDGRDLGRVKDLHFDERTGEILGYELANNAFAGLLPRRYILPPNHGLTVGVDVVLVEPEAAALLERKSDALKRFEEERT